MGYEVIWMLVNINVMLMALTTYYKMFEKKH